MTAASDTSSSRGWRRARLAATELYLLASPPPEAPAAWIGPLAAALASGAGAVQWRAKAADTASRREALRWLRAELPAGTLLLINDDLEALFDAGGRPLADGLHLGREDAAALDGRTGPATPERIAAGLRQARARLGPELLLGSSTSCLAEVDTALAAGADHVGFGALAESATRPGSRRADPAELSRVLAAHPDTPVFPIGGLGPDTLALAVAAGARRAAIGAAILLAPDPAAATARCLALLRGHVRN